MLQWIMPSVSHIMNVCGSFERFIEGSYGVKPGIDILARFESGSELVMGFHHHTITEGDNF